MDIATVFAQECFEDIAKNMSFVRSGSYYYRIVNDIFICFGFQPLGRHFRLVVIITPLITGIGKYDGTDKIIWYPRDYSKEIGFSQGEHYDVQIPEKRALMKEYNRSIFLKIKPELESVRDLQTAYDVINRKSEHGPFRRFLIPETKEAIILYRIGRIEQAANVKNLQYHPELKEQIITRNDKAIDRLTESEFERSVEWLKKHRFCRNVVGGMLGERLSKTVSRGRFS